VVDCGTPLTRRPTDWHTQVVAEEELVGSWVAAAVAFGVPLAVVGAGVWALTRKRLARHARDGDDPAVPLVVMDGVRSPWHPRPWTGPVDGRDRGASAVEYGLMIAAIAAVLVGVVFGLGGALSRVFSSTSSRIEHCTGGDPSPCPDPGTGSSTGGGGDPQTGP
jgi:pilus assembly protein Flp/PilA